MKDYLNNEERKQIIAALHLMDNSLFLIEGNALSSQEKGNLKRGVTFAKKATDSVKDRLNPEARKSLDKDVVKSKVYIDICRATEEYAKKKQTDISAAYEENRDYYKLVELIMYYNCSNCTRGCSNCEIYKEFERHCIPDFDGAKHIGNCRYSYEVIEK